MGNPKPAPEPLATEKSSRRGRPVWATGMLLSVALHMAVFQLWGRVATPVEPRPGREAQAAFSVVPGGGAMYAVALTSPARVEIPPPPAPRLAVDAPVVEFDEPKTRLEGLSLQPVATAGAMPGLGGGITGSGTGEGSGAGEDYTSPVPRSIVPYWDPPPAVKGMEVTVRVMVDDRGRPVGEVELDPPTPHDGFNRQIVERIRRMEYHPARRNGRPVAGWAEITFVF